MKKTHLITAMALLIISISCIWKKGIAQNVIGSERKFKYHARLGDVSGTKTTFSKILANPKLSSIEPGGVVKNFTVIFLPKGKDMLGPYSQRDNAGEKLSQRETELIKGFKEAKEMKLRLIIEHIIVEHNNVTDTAAPIVLFVDSE